MSANTATVEQDQREHIRAVADARGLRDAMEYLAYDYVVNAEKLGNDRLRMWLAGSSASEFVVDVAALDGWRVECIKFEQSSVVFTRGDQ